MRWISVRLWREVIPDGNRHGIEGYRVGSMRAEVGLKIPIPIWLGKWLFNRIPYTSGSNNA